MVEMEESRLDLYKSANVSERLSVNTQDLEYHYYLLSVVSSVTLFSTIYSYLQSIMGCTCNVLSFIVLSKQSCKNTNISLYLRFLCVSDTGALLNNLVRYLMITFTGIDLNYYDSGCKVLVWVSNITIFSSSWTLVTVTIERVICISWPYMAREFCTRRKAGLAMASIFVIWASLLTSYALQTGTKEVFDSSSNTTTVYSCVFTNKHSDTISDEVVFILFGMSWSFVPSIILIVSTVVIVCALRKSQQRRKTMGQKDKTGDSRTAKNTSMTVTLLCVNVCFVLCNFPIAIFMMSPLFLRPNGPIQSLLHVLVFRALLLLMYTNNAINFFLYVATGSKFRQELKRFLRQTCFCGRVLSQYT